MMETSSIIFLLVSGAISFGLGRIFLHLRNKKRCRLAQERAAQTRRKQPPDIESRNKS